MIAQMKSARLAKASSHGRCGVNPGEIIQFCRYSLGAGKIAVGRVAEFGFVLCWPVLFYLLIFRF
jgi:hypothetical protein